MFLDYLNEREGMECVKNDHGFALYKVEGEYCLLSDVYVIPEKRNRSIATELASEIWREAKKRGCKFLISQVDLKDKNASASLGAQLKFGFKLNKAENGIITTWMEI